MYVYSLPSSGYHDQDSYTNSMDPYRLCLIVYCVSTNYELGIDEPKTFSQHNSDNFEHNTS